MQAKTERKREKMLRVLTGQSHSVNTMLTSNLWIKTNIDFMWQLAANPAANCHPHCQAHSVLSNTAKEYVVKVRTYWVARVGVVTVVLLVCKTCRGFHTRHVDICDTSTTEQQCMTPASKTLGDFIFLFKLKFETKLRSKTKLNLSKPVLSGIT